jgi:O-acetyl-ADP-ribose deacetylase (regulator of RNase III)
VGDIEAFRRALEEAPGSLRELARAAHVSHTLLLRVRDGKRELTDDVAEAVATALSEWSETCAELAASLGQGDER